MKNYFPTTREWGYPAFIEELKPMIEEARAFDHHARRHDSEVFRVWRHKIGDLCTRISRSHMDSDTRLGQRSFMVQSYGSFTARDQAEAFDRDMHDTLIELQHIVDQYGKYGEPRMRAGYAPKAAPAAAPAAEPISPAKAAEPEWPQKDKLTLYWLLKNMPMSAWAVVGALCVGAYGLGTTVGAWPSVQKWFEPPAKAAKP